MRKNLLLKIIVLLIAAALWLQQILLREHTESYKLPVHLVNVSPNLAQKSESIPLIPVIIKARGIDLLYLKLSNTIFEVDASGYKAGDNNLALSVNNLNLHKRADVELLNIAAGENLYVNMDRVIEQRKYIELQFETAEDEEFFTHNKIQITGLRVSVSGPESLVRNIKRLKTEKLSRDNIVNEKIKVTLLRPDARVQLQREQLNLEILQTRITTKTISLIPIYYPHNLEISIIPQKVTVMLNGPEELLQSINKNSITALLDVSNIDRIEYTGIIFELPTGIRIQEYTPNKIQVIKND